MKRIPDLLSMSRIALCLPLLFIGMMTIGQSRFIPIAWTIAFIALFAAIQEGHFIRSK